jgi:hypothetical protein
VEKTGAGLWLLRIAGSLGVAVVVLFPLLAGMTPIADDWDYLTGYLEGASFSEVWSTKWNDVFFRPIDILGGAVVDTETLSGGNYVPLLATGFVVLVLGIWTGLSRAQKRAQLPVDREPVFWLVILWLVLHPSTTVCLWQMDTASQVWSAAAGVWLGLAVWKWVECVRQGERSYGLLVLIAVLQLFGLLTKETFLGWCASYTLVLLGLATRSWRRGRSRNAGSFAALGLTLVLVSLIYLACRAEFGGLSLGHGKYSGNVAVNTIANTVLTFVGGLATGPIHVMRNPAALLAAKALVVVGLGISAVLAGLGLYSLRRLESLRSGAGGTLAVAAFACIGSISACLPTTHISEVYLLGPNVGFGLLVVLGVLELARRGWRHGRQKLAGLLLALFCLVSVFGLFSRMQHFIVTWDHATAMRREAVERIQALPEAANKAVVMVSGAFIMEGYVHSTYVVPPLRTIASPDLEAWLDHVMFPSRRIRVVGSPGDRDSTSSVVLVSGDGRARRPRY